MSLDYGHAAFLLLRCWLHPEARGVAATASGLPICRACVEVELAAA